MKKRLLIIEDCVTMQRFLAAYLRKDYELTLVSSQHEAKCAIIASAQTFDAILVDINLSDGSGLHFIKEMKINEQFSTPMIAMSGSKNINMRLDTLETGAVDFIKKPFLPKELAIRLKNAMVNHPVRFKTEVQDAFKNASPLLFAN